MKKKESREPLVTVIANFYKSERYIDKLVRSVLAQSFADFELLCVNDCSPGHDRQMLEAWAAKDARIRVVNNEVNLGICRAKWKGMAEARGKYLMFIDGDDWLETDAIKSMVMPAEQYALDLVVMNSRKVLPVLRYGKPLRSQVDCFDTPLYMPDVRERFYINFFGVDCFGVAYWGKLYRRQMIVDAHIEQPSDILAEDFVFNLRLFPHVQSMMFVDYTGYNWRWGGSPVARRMTSGLQRRCCASRMKSMSNQSS